jgi:MEMO1 family protein
MTPVRPPAVAGSFYPAGPTELRRLVDGLLASVSAPPGGAPQASAAPGPLPAGILVPHAGLVYSGVTAAAGWSCLRQDQPMTVVLLGTNHRAGWLEGIGVWDAGTWSTPIGEVAVDQALATDIAALGRPFHVDRDAHLGEHSIEVQLPLLSTVAPSARIVSLAVSAGTGSTAVEAGIQLGRLLATRRAAGDPLVLAVSTDMAHYPDAAASRRVTETLLPAILALDAAGLARMEADLRRGGIRGLACGMCGIEPAVLGLAALRAMGARAGTELAASTSADAGGPPDRTVGYLAVRFDI